MSAQRYRKMEEEEAEAPSWESILRAAKPWRAGRQRWAAGSNKTTWPASELALEREKEKEEKPLSSCCTQ